MQTCLALPVQFCRARFLPFASLFPLCLLPLSPSLLLLLLLKNIKGALVLVEVVQAEGIIDRVILLGGGGERSRNFALKTKLCGERKKSRGFGWRIHCSVEVTESSTNRQHILSFYGTRWC
jgi:hypothetical protein